jgi:ribonuclease HI
MAGSKGPKWYAVKKGRIPGVYRTWSECQSQTNGFSCALFKSFHTEAKARTFVDIGGTGGGKTSIQKIQSYDGVVEASSSSFLDDTATKKRNLAPTRSSSEQGNNTPAERMQSKKQRTSLSESSFYDLFVVLHFDGASRGNPGISGAGACVRVKTRDPSSVKEMHIRHFVGMKCTNNVAEYNGLLQGLKGISTVVEEYALRSSQSTTLKNVSVNIKGDSNLIINQMNGLYQCKHENMKPLFKECCDIIESLRKLEKDNFAVEISFAHVYRHDNKVADALANEAVDSKKTWTEITLNPKEALDPRDSAVLVRKKKALSIGEKHSDLAFVDV